MAALALAALVLQEPPPASSSFPKTPTPELFGRESFARLAPATVVAARRVKAKQINPGEASLLQNKTCHKGKRTKVGARAISAGRLKISAAVAVEANVLTAAGPASNESSCRPLGATGTKALMDARRARPSDTRPRAERTTTTGRPCTLKLGRYTRDRCQAGTSACTRTSSWARPPSKRRA